MRKIYYRVYDPSCKMTFKIFYLLKYVERDMRANHEATVRDSRVCIKIVDVSIKLSNS